MARKGSPLSGGQISSQERENCSRTVKTTYSVMPGFRPTRSKSAHPARNKSKFGPPLGPLLSNSGPGRDHQWWAEFGYFPELGGPNLDIFGGVGRIWVPPMGRHADDETWLGGGAAVLYRVTGCEDHVSGFPSCVCVPSAGQDFVRVF